MTELEHGITEGASATNTTVPRARNDEVLRPNLSQVLDLAIDEKNAVNFIFLKNVISALLKVLKLEQEEISLRNEIFPTGDSALSLVKSTVSGDSQSENIQSITDLMKESFEQAHSKPDIVNSDLVNPEAKFQASLINADRFKNPRKSSVISDALKLPGLEHKVDGHEKDIKSIFDVLDQVSVTATAADVRTNELIDAQNNLAKGLQDQGDRCDIFDSNMSKLVEELKNVQAQVGDGGKVPWALLTSAMRFFHDRTDFDRDLIREETKDKEIEDFVAAIDKTHMRFMLRSDLETQLDNLEEKNGQMFNGLANETNERFDAMDRNQKGIRDFIKNLRPILTNLSPSGSAEEIDRITNLALTESMRSLMPSNTTLASGKSNGSTGSGGGINVTEEEFGKKVTDFITPILEAKDKALDEANDKIGQLEGLLYDVRRDLGLLTDQVALIVENAESQIGGETESESDGEMKAIIEDLESKFARMESDLKILLHSDATEAQLKKINEMFEEFKTNTITKDEFVAGIEDKADKEEIANIIQREEYDSGVCSLNNSLNILSAKIKEHALIDNRINLLASETERKISRDELSIVKSEIKTEFGTLKTLMEIKEQNDRKRKQKWAAIGIPVNCLSCKDTTYQKKIPYSYDNNDSNNVYAALEMKEALQIKKTIGPYRSYELDTLRKLSRNGKPIGKAIQNMEIHRRRIDLEEQAQSRRTLRKLKRACGGSHTMISTHEDFSLSPSCPGSRPKSKKPSKQATIKTKQAASVDELSLEEILLYSNNGRVYR